MTSTKTLRRHAALVDSMANTLGIDLQEQALRGNLPISEIEDAVLRCTGCTQPDACEHWLATRSGVEPETPSYCRNSDLFEDLRLR
ncbi:DUF6455 family protein [Pseudoprimorskyibacter insulae]|uniref:DUF6455 domain-containing protein n=1 Tax=Pseudoprimorskyibacter insulae TaxID=1695997 RepID=A0A2R8AYR2_9RHOB|nr:DUF6455 family protein [Pseudoprimorskyibacter insulae]SPF81166.1 hypothetical protein PRI8871_02988 [Pseudoprimorskyibacter insulae]